MKTRKERKYTWLLIIAAAAAALSAGMLVFSVLSGLELNLYRIGYFGYTDSVAVYLQFLLIPFMAVAASLGRKFKKTVLYILPMIVMMLGFLGRMGGYVLFYKEERVTYLDVNKFASNFYYIFIVIMFLSALSVFLTFIGGKTIIKTNGVLSKITAVAGIAVYGFLTIVFFPMALMNLSDSSTVNSILSLMSFADDLLIFVWLFIYFNADTCERLGELIEFKKIIDKKADKAETLDIE